MNRLQRRNYGSGHGYQLDGRKVPGVTTVIGVMDKPALVNWAAEQSAGYAVEHWARLSEMPIMERAKEISGARFATNKRATVRGHRIHELGEQLLLTGESDAPDEFRGPVEAYARFLNTWMIEPITTEAPVGHTEYQYAGTLDVIAKSPLLGTILLDIKTGKGVWPEVALQLAAYRYADLLLTPREVVGPRGGKRTEYDERPMIEVDDCYVAHVLADDVELVPVRAGRAEFETFLYLREVFDWKRIATDRKDDDYHPPVGAAVFPEQFEAVGS